MANRFEVFDVTVPASTLKANAVETPTAFADGIVTGVEIVIPDGHAGLTGIAILQAHSQVIPWTSGAYITGNDEIIKWDTAGFIQNGAWSVSCYNSDVYAHTFHVRYLVNESTIGGPGSLAYIQQPVVVGNAQPSDLAGISNIPAPATQGG